MQSELLKKIELNASRGKPYPNGIKPPEIMLYYMLLGIYGAYQNGKITKEKGHSHKQSAYNTYKQIKDEYDRYIEVCREMQDIIRDGYSIGGVTVVKGKGNEGESVQDGSTNPQNSAG